MNRKRATKIMQTKSLGGLIATTLENIQYLTGIQMRLSNRTSDIVTILSVDPKLPPAIIIPSIKVINIAQNTFDNKLNIYRYGDFFIENGVNPTIYPKIDTQMQRMMDLFSTSPVFKNFKEALQCVLKDYSLNGATIAVDEMGLSPEIYSFLKDDSTCNVLPGYDLFREIRMIKTACEIEAIKRAASINEEAVEDMITLIKPGITEQAIVEAFRLGVASRGGEPKGVTVGSGGRSACPIIETYVGKVSTNDLIRYDVSSVYKGFHADTGRTLVVGTPNQLHKKHYDIIYKAWKDALNQAKKGKRVCDIFNTAIQNIQDAGISHYKRHHIGHGIGLEVYELPMLSNNDATILEPGMVFNLELPYYEIGFGGFQIEDTVVVTETGHELLTKASRDLRVL